MLASSEAPFFSEINKWGQTLNVPHHGAAAFLRSANMRGSIGNILSVYLIYFAEQSQNNMHSLTTM